MGTMWHYAKNKQQRGPITDAELLQLARSGGISGQDLVWSQGMADWMPAARVPLLKDAFVQSATATPVPEAPQSGVPISDSPNAVAAEVLQYSAPAMESFTVTARALEMLRRTRPWVRFISIIMLVFAGLMVVLGCIVAAAGGMGRSSPPGFIGIIYVAMAAFYIAPAMYLSRYASKISALLNLRRADLLEAALEAQKSFWKFVGIVAIVIVSIYGVGAMIAIIAIVAR